MTGLDTADAERLWRVGGRFAEVATSLREVQEATGRAARATWRWRGPASEHFEAALGVVERHTGRARPPYEQVAGAIRQYAAVVEESAEQLRRAAGIRSRAAVMSARAPAVGPDPGEGLRWQAVQLERQARAAHEAAAVRAASLIRAAEASLPRAPRGTGWSRFTTDLVDGSWQQVTGLAGFGLLAARAMRGDGHARTEVWSAAQGAWRVWEPAVQAWHDLRDGRYGLVASGVLGMAVGRFRPRRVTDLEVAHGEALQAARWSALQDALGVSEGPAGQFDPRLWVQESLGGHAVREHVAKSEAYLRWRADQKGLASSFSDARTAQRAVETVLAARPGRGLERMAAPGRGIGRDHRGRRCACRALATAAGERRCLPQLPSRSS